MLKNQFQICKQLVNFSLRPFEQSRKQQTPNLNFVQKQYFFWNKSKNDESEQQNQNGNNQVNLNNSSTNQQWQNIGYLIEQVKIDNQKKPKLLQSKSIEDQDKLTVFIEMDEVLVYVFSPDEFETYMSAPERDYDHLFEYKDYDTYLSIYKRPYLQSFLQYLRENTEPILYSNGVKSYVTAIMNIIDPNNTFRHIICQEDGCTRIVNEKENMDEYFKDLNLMNRDLTRSVYIDSKAINFWSHPDNGLPVSEYLADSTINDQELLHLIKFLEELKHVPDVREILKEKFQIQKALEESNML